MRRSIHAALAAALPAPPAAAALPMKIEGGSGAPVRVVALVPG